MKLCCKVTVLDRKLQASSVNYCTKYKQAVIGFVQQGKERETYLKLVTANQKAGSSYKIKGNIEKLFDRFYGEGKCTIRFKEPSHDLCIITEKALLNNFIKCFKKIWKGKDDVVLGKMCMVQEPITNSYTITDKKKYPILKGFPSFLTKLTVNDCKLRQFDLRILKLKNLICLNLSSNELTSIPANLSALPLKELYLADNKLGEENWACFTGVLANSMMYLDLSGNGMKCLPASLSRFNSLIALNISRNLITSVPFRLCQLPLLKHLNLSHNQLMALPGTIKREFLSKLQTLDLSDNNLVTENPEMNKFMLCTTFLKKNHVGYVHSLVEIAGECVINGRLWYSEETLPGELVRLLDNAGKCICRKTTIRDYGIIPYNAESGSLAHSFISSERITCIPIIFTACSKKIFDHC